MLVSVAGCATTPLARPEDVTFASSLQINLAAMERLPSGVYFRDLREGSGGAARPNARVAVHYVGYLPDGTMFDGVASPSAPLEFQLGAREVIRGWEQGIPGMREGGQRVLAVPAELAYGRQGQGRVPGNAVLVFIIELVRAR